MNRKGNSIIQFVLIFLELILLSACTLVDNKISMESLLLEMTNREILAQFSAPEFIVSQFSSYDRASKIPGHYSWFANQDNNYFIRTETKNGRREFVMFDSEGPGAVVRFWTTNRPDKRVEKKGVLRFYFDNEDEPRIEGEAKELISGGKLVAYPLSFSVSEKTVYERRGHNLYLPIPYSKHLKITYETEGIQEARDCTQSKTNDVDEEMFWYQINYRTYKKKVRVKTFEMADLTINGKTIENTLTKLKNCERGLTELQLQNEHFLKKLYPGCQEEISISGEKAIRHIQLKIKASNIRQALRSTVITATFDGQKTIWAPLGEFFGAGYKIIPAKTWYQEVRPDSTLEVFWVMPFKENCSLHFINYGNQQVELEGKIVTAPWKWDQKSMHFGSSWHQYTKINTGLVKNYDGSGDMYDLNFTRLEGKGKYVGDGLTLFDCSTTWWGEGDEKIFVDGEKFPSHFGTGTEDYYGYAWCRWEKFIHPFIAQPEGSGNGGADRYTVNLRFRSLDAIPFQKSLNFDMEMWHAGNTRMNYAPVTFWYIMPEGHCLIQPDIEGVKGEVVLHREQILPPIMNDRQIINGADLIVSGTSGKITTQIIPFPVPNKPKWYKSLITWSKARPGDKVNLRFICNEAGNYNIECSFYMVKGTSRISFSINNKSIINGYNVRAEKPELKQINLKQVELVKGYNELAVKILDSSEFQGSNYGIEFLKFKKL